MKYVKWFLILTFLYSCSSNNNEIIKEKNLSFQKKEQLRIKKNKIKSITIFEYGYKFGKIENEGELYSIQYFDTNGCETETQEVFRDNKVPTVKYFHSYDSLGRRIKTTDELYVNNNEPYTIKNYRYDEKGNISETVDYYMDGDLAWKNVYYYDVNNLLIKITSNNKKLIEFEYDSSKNMIRTTEYKTFFEKDYIEVWNYKYDNDKIFEAIEYDKGEPYKIRKYSYQYY